MRTRVLMMSVSWFPASAGTCSRLRRQTPGLLDVVVGFRRRRVSVQRARTSQEDKAAGRRRGGRIRVRCRGQRIGSEKLNRGRRHGVGGNEPLMTTERSAQMAYLGPFGR
jgi:hypothetical protein